MVERLLPTPEIRGSNPVIAQNLYVLSTVLKDKKTKKRPATAHLTKIKSGE